MNQGNADRFDTWAHRFAGCVVALPLVAAVLVGIFNLSLHKFRIFLPVANMNGILVFFCAIGGIFYLFAAAKFSSRKYAIIGWTALIIAFETFIFVFWGTNLIIN